MRIFIKSFFKLVVIILCCFSFLLFGFTNSNNTLIPPKNIILLIIDGCGFNHIDAGSFYEYGKTGVQPYEKFPIKYAMSTYSLNGNGYSSKDAWTRFDYVNNKPTDSAAAATAISTGCKTNNGKIGVDGSNTPLENVIQKAEKLGKSTGVVTSVCFSDATPAGFVAHNINRGNLSQIAEEMILRSGVDVIMGCGHPMYNNNGEIVEKSDYKYVGGDSIWDGLVSGTIGNDADGDGKDDKWTLIQDRSEFQAIMN